MPISYEVKDNKIYFKTPYHQDFITELRKLKSRHYEKDGINSISIFNESDILAVNHLVKKFFNFDLNLNQKIASTKPFGAVKIVSGKVIFKTVTYDEKFNDDLKKKFRNYHFNWNDHTWEVFISSNTNFNIFQHFFKMYRIIFRPEFETEFKNIAKYSIEMKMKREDLVKASSMPAAPANFTYKLPDPVLSLFSYQEGGVFFLEETKGNALIADEMGLGKAQPLTSRILTPDGWKLMKDIEVGDEIINSEGNTSNITGIFPQGKKSVYRVEFTDGSFVECCNEHLWLVNTPTRIFRGSAGKIKSLAEIMSDLRHKNGNLKNFIPMVKPVNFKDQLCSINPYVLGLLLGDGSFVYNTVRFTTNSNELKLAIEKTLPAGIFMKKNGEYDWTITGGRTGKINSFTSKLHKLGLIGCDSRSKFIPHNYLYNTIEIRVAILQGILDTDGSVSKDNTIEYTSVSKRLIEDVKFIVQSLGGTARIRVRKTSWSYKGEKKQGSAYRMIICLPNGIFPFRLKRKAEKYHSREKYQPTRAIKKISFVGEKECQCIMTDAPDHLYVTNNFIVTHNTVQVLVYLYNQSLKRPVLVVVPGFVKINWFREIKKWMDLKDNDIHYIEGQKTSSLPLNKQIYLINYDILHYWIDELMKLGFKCVVFDESHKIKNYKAKRTISAITLSRKVSSVICLTGTPIINKPIDIWTTIKLLKKEAEFGSVGLFMFKYCGAFHDNHGNLITDGASNIDELQVKLRSGIMIRRTKKDVLPFLPSRHRMKMEFDLDNRKEYDTIKNDFSAWLKAKTGKTITEGEAVVQIEMLKQSSARGKLNSMVKFILETVENDDKVVVFAHHKEILAALRREITKAKIPLFEIVGGKTTKEKQEAVDQFTASKTGVCLCSLIGGSEGGNLQTASTVIFCELGWTSSEHDQAESRVHRIGQDHICNIYYCIAPDSIDYLIWNVLRSKQEMIDKSIDGMTVENEKNRNFINEVLEKMRKERY